MMKILIVFLNSVQKVQVIRLVRKCVLVALEATEQLNVQLNDLTTRKHSRKLQAVMTIKRRPVQLLVIEFGGI